MSNDDRLENLREEVTGADDTGMIANEEFITQAEMLHGLLPPEHPAHAKIDELHAEMRSASPDPIRRSTSS